jgi:hypothetical protein
MANEALNRSARPGAPKSPAAAPAGAAAGDIFFTRSAAVGASPLVTPAMTGAAMRDRAALGAAPAVAPALASRPSPLHVRNSRSANGEPIQRQGLDRHGGGGCRADNQKAGKHSAGGKFRHDSLSSEVLRSCRESHCALAVPQKRYIFSHEPVRSEDERQRGTIRLHFTRPDALRLSSVLSPPTRRGRSRAAGLFGC